MAHEVLKTDGFDRPGHDFNRVFLSSLHLILRSLFSFFAHDDVILLSLSLSFLLLQRNKKSPPRESCQTATLITTTDSFLDCKTPRARASDAKSFVLFLKSFSSNSKPKEQDFKFFEILFSLRAHKPKREI